MLNFVWITNHIFWKPKINKFVKKYKKVKEHLPNDNFLPVPAVTFLRICPTSVEPVKATLSTSGWIAMLDPILPLPVMTLNTPGGSLKVYSYSLEKGSVVS